jgi:glucose-6-phosphate dehydrogenase assembly protein OpcA
VSVGLDELERILAGLRREATGARELAVRTNILDLVVVCDSADVAHELTDAIAELPYNRPSRAIVALIADGSSELEFDARVFCTPARQDDARIAACSELVAFSSGDGGAGLPSLVAGLLLPDLPVFLLWRTAGSGPQGLLDRLWPLITRVVVDSTADAQALRDVPELMARRPARDVTDLSWTKLTGWRDTVARLFDAPESARALRRLERVEISHAGASREQARLLAGWIASRTQRRPEFAIEGERRADMRSGSLTGVCLTCAGERYEARRVDEGVASLHAPNMPAHALRLRVPHLRELIAQEFEIFGRDELFEQALAAVPD